jgi:predicted RNase H-like HicB family nuclease
MKTNELILRCFAERKGNQWQAFCLEFGLAAQADTLEEARRKLDDMICSYVEDATVGADRAFGADLLSRGAPLLDWIKYYFYAARKRLLRHGVPQQFREVLPLHPGKCHA